MLTEICKELKNWFESDKIFSVFKIEGGIISPPISNLKGGQFYRIIGSTFNDGVHKFGDSDLIDEEFDGAIWLMNVPRELVNLSDEIKVYNGKYNDKSPFLSESFGGYSYSKSTGSNGVPATWKNIYSSDLNRWRKI